ncbi:hypothetical protein NPIL_422191 [Nephila pilipes]|uniref:Uncharacterized protein n=1 Tax=Nephila pilipes TaxID=299642 RepID=A0A8X6NAL8_NEPPI|nr:hypothetical protein NPIL_422191 [Nephila pilipes]
MSQKLKKLGRKIKIQFQNGSFQNEQVRIRTKLQILQMAQIKNGREERRRLREKKFPNLSSHFGTEQRESNFQSAQYRKRVVRCYGNSKRAKKSELVDRWRFHK